MKALVQMAVALVAAGGLTACVADGAPNTKKVVTLTESDRPSDWTLDSAKRLILSVRTGPDSGGPTDVVGVVRLSNGST